MIKDYGVFDAVFKSISLRREPMYEAPEIVYEGDLEIQAGSPLGAPGGLGFDLEE